jgi:hypothetical protein
LPEATLPPGRINAPDIRLDSVPPGPGIAAEGAARPGRGHVYALFGAVGLLGLAAAGYYFGGERDTKPVAEPSVEAAAPAASVAATAPPPATLPTPAPAPVPAPVVVAAPAPVIETPAPPPASATTAPMVSAAASKPKREPRIVEPRVAEPRPVAAEPAPKPAPTNTAGNKARCSDILQKASLEPLTASEAEFLKKECR